MSSIDDIAPGEIAEALQTAGIAGAGGAGFPSYVKWQEPSDVDYLLMNHQESEPNCYADKWLGREYAGAFNELFESLLGTVFDAIVVGTKAKYRNSWMETFETVSESTVYEPVDLPADVSDEQGVVFAYTPDVYTYSEESVLLMVTAGEQINDDLPTDHGWIVHNTETLFNIHQALSSGTPVTHKYVHVGGDVPRHRCLKVPIGTPASDLLKAAGVDSGQVDKDQIIADGGPGWCYEIDDPAREFGVRKRTNAVLVLDSAVARNHTEEDGRINMLDAYNWSSDDHETAPHTLSPDSVRVPLITNAAYTGFVAPSEPTVESGEEVSTGDVIAAAGEGISNIQHAPVTGEISEITDTHIIIDRV